MGGNGGFVERQHWFAWVTASFMMLRDGDFTEIGEMLILRGYR